MIIDGIEDLMRGSSEKRQRSGRFFVPESTESCPDEDQAWVQVGIACPLTRTEGGETGLGEERPVYLERPKYGGQNR